MFLPCKVSNAFQIYRIYRFNIALSFKSSIKTRILIIKLSLYITFWLKNFVKYFFQDLDLACGYNFKLDLGSSVLFFVELEDFNLLVAYALWLGSLDVKSVSICVLFVVMRQRLGPAREVSLVV